LFRSIEVDLDKSTWGSKPVPTWLSGGTGIQQIDLLAALFLLGNITMPNILSIASPARFWAWLRYYLAPADQQELQIIIPFAELDPHQKGILSDDFGVAISTHWLCSQLGGFRQIVDGRKFVQQFPGLYAGKISSGAKVGATKTPDFVIEGLDGKWHVLECKGTQSGRASRDNFLKRAIQQKSMIDIIGNMCGQRLAAGLSITTVGQRERTHLKVVDPAPEPILSLGEKDRERVTRAAKRLSIARSMAIIGMTEAASELSYPSDLSSFDAIPFMTRSERTRSRRKRSERIDDVIGQIRGASLDGFESHSEKFFGRVMEFEFPFGAGKLSGAKARIRQGVSEEVWRAAKTTNPQDFSFFEDRSEEVDAGVVVEAHVDYVSIAYGRSFFADMRLKRRQ